MSLSRRATFHSTLIDDDIQPLTPEEIQSFLDELDHNNDGIIQYSEVESALDRVNDELTPTPKPHNINHPSKEEHARHAFLRELLGTTSDTNPSSISRDEFADRIELWKIPSMTQSRSTEEADLEYMSSIGWWRRFRSWWAVKGPEVMFLVIVSASIVGMMLWQSLKYSLDPDYRAAFGWGVVLAKTCAGGLYFTMFFLISSMSRYFSTFLRRWYYLSRFINPDLSQSFHIKISILAITLSTLHAIGHLGGTFVYGSKLARQDAVAAILSPELVPRPYQAYLRSLPGITGLTALGLFYTLAGLSIPQVRKWNYEVFQLGHLLMYPIIGLLMAHGTSRLLQFPMLGYFLAFPTLLVLLERVTRFFLGFGGGIPARVKMLDSDTIQITIPIHASTIKIKTGMKWKYKPGQYIFLQAPKVSRFEWHPFTISSCINDQVKLHIKTDGNWTTRLRRLIPQDQTEGEIRVGLNGPFGAPAQRFYDFTHTILVGSGIGVTPFAGILADLQERDERLHDTSESEKHGQGNDPGEKTSSSTSAKTGTTLGQTLSRTLSRARSRSRRRSTISPYPSDYRRVDFHWMVRDKNHLGWFSNLLNSISQSQEYHQSPTQHQCVHPHLDIRLQTHVTAKRQSLTTHIYRWLLEIHRTGGIPTLALDGHYEDMVEYQRSTTQMGDEGRAGRAGSKLKDIIKVGVFFCGAPMIGEILADRCRALNKRGEEEGVGIRYHFMIEVFG
ncbi:uncharacterized protein L199_001611 [Kwoniella botswanensis]|uniref:uncharacterized protein n=1 Tax=Kwoniella botswanensis TaxID=1268659 RepID=UPI00315D1A40